MRLPLSSFMLSVMALMLAFVPACITVVAPPGSSNYTSEELMQIEEHHFWEFYSEMKGYTGDAHSLTLELQDFHWDGFSAIGWRSEYEYRPGVGWKCLDKCPPYPTPIYAIGTPLSLHVSTADLVSKGYTYEEAYWIYKSGQMAEKPDNPKWYSVSEVLPCKEAASPLLAQCDECIALATKVWSERPYKEPKTAVQKMQKLTISEWRELCHELESALRVARNQATGVKSETYHLFTQVGQGLSFVTSIRERYLEEFRRQSAEYTDILDEVIHNLEQAELVASEVGNWEFNSLATDQE